MRQSLSAILGGASVVPAVVPVVFAGAHAKEDTRISARTNANNDLFIKSPFPQYLRLYYTILFLKSQRLTISAPQFLNELIKREQFRYRRLPLLIGEG